MLPLTLQFVIAMIASAINERMRRKLDCALEEVRVLKEILRAATGKDRISFAPDQRRRLALAGIELTPKERRECCQIIKPGTILTWFRGLAARKYDSSQRWPAQERAPGGRHVQGAATAHGVRSGRQAGRGVAFAWHQEPVNACSPAPP
jgi:hypothetical protein